MKLTSIARFSVLLLPLTFSIPDALRIKSTADLEHIINKIPQGD